MNTRSSPRLLFFYSDLGIGGVQKKMVDTILELSKQPFPVEIHVVLRQKSDHILQPYLPSSVRIHILPPHSNRWLNALRNTIRLWYLLLRIRPQTIVIYLHYQLHALVLARRLSSFFFPPTLILSQDGPLENFALQYFPRWFIHWGYSYCSFFLSPTHRITAELVSLDPQFAQRILTFSNWVPSALSTEVLPQKRDIDILYCGRFSAEKNIPLLVQMCNDFLQKNPQTHITFVGGPLEEISDPTPHITFFPPQADTRLFFSRAKILILASTYEGYPLTLLESLKYGCIPVVMFYPGLDEYYPFPELIASSSEEMQQIIHRVLSDQKWYKQQYQKLAAFYHHQQTDSGRTKTVQTLLSTL